MSRVIVTLICAIIIAFTCSVAELPSPTCEFNNTFFHNQSSTLNLTGGAPFDWKEGQPDDNRYQLLTNGWIFEPTTGKTGQRFSTVNVFFGEDCYKSFNDTKLRMVLYPFGYPAYAPNFSDWESNDTVPSFVQVVTALQFDNTTHTFEKNFSSGEVFLGWGCCVSLQTTKQKDQYFIKQANMTKCIVTFEAFGPTVLVPSLKLFYGTLLLILVPAILTVFVHFIMLIAQRNAVDKSEAGFKRANCECRLFWLVWFIAFIIYIVLFWYLYTKRKKISPLAKKKFFLTKQKKNKIKNPFSLFLSIFL